MPVSSLPQCAICQSPICPHETSTTCPACHAPYHAECWSENHGCAVYGCSKVTKTEARGELEIPPAYWGKENKTCAACGATILAAAVRCRSCGAVFDSALPESAHDYRRRQDLARRMPDLKRHAITLFIFSILPCTAPLAVALGFMWYRSNREALATLPAIHSALCRLGLLVGTTQTAVAFLSVVLFLLRHAS